MIQMYSYLLNGYEQRSESFTDLQMYNTLRGAMRVYIPNVDALPDNYPDDLAKAVDANLLHLPANRLYIETSTTDIDEKHQAHPGGIKGSLKVAAIMSEVLVSEVSHKTQEAAFHSGLPDNHPIFLVQACVSKDNKPEHVSPIVYLLMITYVGYGLADTKRPQQLNTRVVVFNTEKNEVVKQADKHEFAEMFESLVTFTGKCLYHSMVMSCTNVTLVDNLPPAKLNKKRVKRGNPPLYSFKTIQITGESTRNIQTGHGGTRASPRFHTRRGHIRHLKSGEMTWVRSTKVGNPMRGVVEHDYELV